MVLSQQPGCCPVLTQVGIPHANVIAPLGNGSTAAEEAASYEARLKEVCLEFSLEGQGHTYSHGVRATAPLCLESAFFP